MKQGSDLCVGMFWLRFLVASLLAACGSWSCLQAGDTASRVAVVIKLDVQPRERVLKVTFTNRTDSTIAFMPALPHLYRVTPCTPWFALSANSVGFLIPWVLVREGGPTHNCDPRMVPFVQNEPSPMLRWVREFRMQPIAIPPTFSAAFTWVIEANDDSAFYRNARCELDSMFLPFYVVDNVFRQRMGASLVEQKVPRAEYVLDYRRVGSPHLNLSQHFLVDNNAGVTLDYDDVDMLMARMFMVTSNGRLGCTCTVVSSPPTDAGE